MTLKEFKELTENLSDDTVLFVRNDGSEWYGEEEMKLVAWDTTLPGRMTFDFMNG